MKLTDLVTEMDLEVRSARHSLGNEVTGGYMSDLLSDVLAHSSDGNLWITLQRHQNIVAVASMKQLAGIVLVAGREPEEETVEKAEAESLPILVSELPAFELAGRLYTLGVRGAVLRGEQARE
ncbi:MAG: DRTGG domain-containing protein [Thermoanaerobaculia bacterium]